MRAKRIKNTDAIELTVLEAQILATMGFICVINGGEVCEVVHEGKE